MLTHIKCAFCSYECLLHKTSRLNTLYKSPFDEHREKSFLTCPIFYKSSDSNNNSLAKSTESPGFTDNQKNYSWLNTLYEFEPNYNVLQLEKLIVENFDGTDLEVRQMPKILDKLEAFFQLNFKNQNAILSATSNQQDEAGGGAGAAGTGGGSLFFVPNAGSSSNLIQKTGDRNKIATSDFSQLTTVLNASDNVLSRKAHHPAYAQYQARLDSFRDWPATLSQQPSELAKAGFYYFGIKDMVKCFFCNGGLKNWDYNDDPFTDHVRWFPTCQFIRQLMGPEFVEKVREKFKNAESGFGDEETKLNMEPSTSSSSSSSGQFGNVARGSAGGSASNSSSATNSSAGASAAFTRPNQRSVSPRTLNSRMDSHIIRKILDYKFLDQKLITKEAIRQSIENKLGVRETGSSGAYGDDFRTPIEMAISSYEVDKRRRVKEENYAMLSDFVIFNLPVEVVSMMIKNVIYIIEGFYPASVK
jgi:hypothetical protein